MLKITKRLYGSAFRTILVSEKGDKFVNTVSKKLDLVKLGELQEEARIVSYWENVHQAAQTMKDKQKEIKQLMAMASETSDSEMKTMAEEEIEQLEQAIDEDLSILAKAIIPVTEIDVLRKCQMEFTSGAGGQEAMLFTGELMNMYRKYAEWRGWKWDPLQIEDVSLGGIRCALISITGESSYSDLRFEAGVHRVQRIPMTDKSRMHTSTSSVSVLPEPDEVSVVVPSDSVKIETMRASGPGGQNVNKRSTAVRMTHKETGIAVHCMEERFQHLNIQIAYKKLAAILMQQKVDELSEKFTSDRKIQVGSKARAEKIRTYNFQHDRITDHRIQMHVNNIEDFMSGTDSLNRMIFNLSLEHTIERLDYIIDQCITN